MPVGDRDGSRAQAVVLGAAIRELRESLGWSQSRLVTALCEVSHHATVTREIISRWETGKRVPGPWWLRHLATVLQVPLEILERAGVDRRHFLTNIAGVSIAPVVASDLIEHGFAAVLHGGYPSVDDWGQAVVTYGRDYMTSGAGEIQKRLAADLVVLQQQRDIPCFWAVGAKLATLYGKTFPGSDGAKALTWPSLSGSSETAWCQRFTAGGVIGDPGVRVNVRSVVVRLAVAEESSRRCRRGRGRRGDRRRVRCVARLVRSTSWRLSPSMRMRRMGRRARFYAGRVCIRRM
jgi:transcriptional regulator with XRE-family HTH domain